MDHDSTGGTSASDPAGESVVGPVNLGRLRQAVETVLTGMPSAHRPTIVAVDGRAGSGKTVLGTALARERDAVLIHMDDLYPGWDGLAAAPALLAGQVLQPLHRGEPAAYRRWDWHREDWGELVPVPATDLLVVEGCGASTGPAAGLVDLAVWVDAPAGVRRDRALARDGEIFAPHWASWASQEEALFTADRTRERAGLVLHTD